MTLLPPPVRFTCPTATGAFYTYGAHVTEWAPTGQDPVLWMSSQSVFKEGTAIRGGVPICLPWFGPGRNKDKSPLHGLARLHNWELISQSQDGDSANFHLRLTGDDLGRPESFPYNFVANFRAAFSNKLEMALTVANRDTQPFTFEEALHTYISVGDIRQIQIAGLEGATYLDKAANAPAPTGTQQGPITFAGETDRVYSSEAPVTLLDPVLKRTLRVTKSGSANTVVWNPWIDKAAAMKDYGDDEWTTMVCIEAANAFDNSITLRPGDTHTLKYTLEIV
ncbi:MAG: D-hexose-6-phosphate mutarotase [Actinomycetaceae bacterium]|nr:D-hexose-6-phosphate mutarotase [Actinomycetaceae bacterium]